MYITTKLSQYIHLISSYSDVSSTSLRIANSICQLLLADDFCFTFDNPSYLFFKSQLDRLYTVLLQLEDYVLHINSMSSAIIHELLSNSFYFSLSEQVQCLSHMLSSDLLCKQSFFDKLNSRYPLTRHQALMLLNCWAIRPLASNTEVQGLIEAITNSGVV
ncbi:hypothetical protein GEMRC1_003230 [Eukaryota sp. GEM-RC1]